VRQLFFERFGEFARLGDSPALPAERGGDLRVIRRFEVHPEVARVIT